MFYVEIRIYIYHGVVAHLLFVLHAELSQCGIEDRGMVFGEESHIYTYLYI